MGHELDGDVMPIDAGLLSMTRKSGGFIGFEALQAKVDEGTKPTIVSLIFDDRTATPLGHEPIYFEGEIIGQTTSCAISYRIGKPIALAHVDRQFSGSETVKVDIARNLVDATVVHGPAFDPNNERMKRH